MKNILFMLFEMASYFLFNGSLSSIYPRITLGVKMHIPWLPVNSVEKKERDKSDIHESQLTS